MLDEIEKSFIECFVVKSKQDRLLFELGGKKRRDGVGRFCHNAEEILRPEKIWEKEAFPVKGKSASK